MTVEYDLAIVGATATAQSAAIAAAYTHARIAWAVETAPECSPLILLREGSSLISRTQQSAPQGFRTEIELIKSVFSERSSPAAAQAAGVNYLEGSILFGPGGLTVNGQPVRARSYLLAIEPEAALPSVPGMIHPRVGTVAQLLQTLQSTQKAWPQTLGILGSGPQAVELSQSIQQLGISAVLLADGGPLLPHEDREAAFLLQTYLEGNGIAVYTNNPLLAVQASSDGLLLELGDCNVEVNALTIATESAGALPEGFAALNLRQTSHGLWVSAALQTSQTSLYACGKLLGGYSIPSIERYEAQLAVQNALFETQASVRYHQVPYAIWSDPPLARVGLTEQQALRYDAEAQVLQQTYQVTERAILNQAPAGLCKVLVQSDGTLLGAHIVGADAPELIHLFALGLQQGIRLQDIGRGGFASPTFTQVLQPIVERWQQRFQQDRDRNERWFYRQRRKAS
jgi:pyruvate/2-oxoglutarate dehydrogenase complex dihydrolipoamide dehydrogenase (E3) component